MVIHITLERTELIVCSAYFPGDINAEEPPPAAIRRLFEFSRRNNIQLIMGCDANAHHTVWGSTNINARGECLLNYLLGVEFMVNNVGSEPTFVTRVRREVLDLTISSVLLSNKITNWRVSSEPSCSDHRHIQFSIDLGYNPVTQYRDPRRLDGDGYKLSLANHLQHGIITVTNCDQVEIAAEQLRTAVIAAYHENCPLKVKRDNRNTSWWNHELQKSRKEVRRLFNRAKVSGEWDQYRDALTNYNKQIRRAKRESWERFCEGIEDVPGSARIHKILSREPAKELGSLKRPNGSFTESRKETLELLAKTHFPGCQILGDTPGELSACGRNRPHGVEWRTSHKIINAQAIRVAVNSFHPYKSPGEDGIFPALLQIGLEILSPHLVRLFRASLAWNFVPSSWAATKVIYIPKLGRTEPEPRAVRPISLTSFLLKSLEKVIDAHVRGGALNVHTLNAHQYAYQAGKSTDMALNNLVGNIASTLQNREIAVAAFLDIEGAFNNTLPDSLHEAAMSRGIEPVVCNWIKAMLKSRLMSSELHGEVVRFRAARGCPQGGVLSPLLWSLLVDDLLAILSVWDIDLQAYADDIVIIVKGNSEEMISNILQEVLNATSQWCAREEMSINPHKMVVVPFTRKRKLDGLIAPTLHGETIQFSKEAKYLGVTLDKTLNWNSHLENTVRKANHALWACRRICGKTWGMRPKQMYWLYVTVIRPIVAYGSVAWWEKGQQRLAQAKLSSLQRQACLLITGAFRTTPTAAMEALLGLTPLHIYLQGEARWATYRLHQAAVSRPQSCHMEGTALLRDIMSRDLLCMPSDVMPRTISHVQTYKITLPTREDWLREERNLVRADVCLYTDGSKTKDGVGAGIFGRSPEAEIQISLGSLATIFQAEVHAIELCARMLIERQTTHKTIKIFSDSQAALKALDSSLFISRTVWSCREKLNDLGTHNSVTLVWIPGHTGLEGNERADALAKAGAEAQFTGPEPVLGVTDSTAKRDITAWTEEIKLQYWRDINGLRHSKMMIDYPLRKVFTDNLLKLDRLELRTLVGLYTGHSGARQHMHRIGLAENAECRLCLEDDETIEHILCQCPAAARLRFSLFGEAVSRLEDIKATTPNTLLCYVKRLGLLGKI